MPELQNFMSKEGFIRTYDLLDALSNDVNTAYKVLEDNKQNQYFRRCVVRAIFSYVEAVIETVKVEVRSSLRLERPCFELSKKEGELLGSLSVISEEKGRQFPLEQNLKSTFKLAAKVWDLDYRLQTDSEDYRDFVIAKSFRNKLTHPKTYYDIEVTDDDMHYHTIAGMWVRAEFERLMKARFDGLEVYIKKYMVT
ncbi:hypothetical protein [Vibrio campbellii]|uniref:hypothetical protein n=1 Tax=Vibrio campbellii TaxID=680 RepID=UPI00210DFEE0|nr:hypothetical protein [Vibrio campbellii]UTZ24162.1 hypothetical protein HB760_20715 [Vibrio campbellii]